MIHIKISRIIFQEANINETFTFTYRHYCILLAYGIITHLLALNELRIATSFFCSFNKSAKSGLKRHPLTHIKECET